MTSPAVELPAYGVGSLADLLPSVGAAMGMAEAPAVLDLPASDRFVVLLVDGLGLDQLAAHPDHAPYLSSLSVESLTAGVPTTTATSLTSFGTGRPPGQHGVVGYSCRIPGTNHILNALKWDTAVVDPVEWQPHPTVFAAMNQNGMAASVVGKRKFATSGLSLASQRGALFVGADSAGERLAAARHAVESPRAMVYVYDGDLDFTGHRDGCGSEAWRLQLATIDSFARQLRDVLPSDTVLVVTSDHGMVDVAPPDRIDVEDEPGMMVGVGLFAGEGRFRHLYCSARAVEGVAARWQDRLGDKALVLTREEALVAGWFGGVESQVEARLGDVLIACMAPIAVTSSRWFPQEAKLVGMHGSLTRAEMLVPLLVDSGAAA